MTYTEDMRVDGHSCLSESHSLHHIGCLASYARQTQETVEIFRHLSVIVCHYPVSYTHLTLPTIA